LSRGQGGGLDNCFQSKGAAVGGSAPLKPKNPLEIIIFTDSGGGGRGTEPPMPSPLIPLWQ